MDVEELLKKQRLKVTPQRKAIIKVLESADAVLSAQEIFTEVIKILPNINFSTIYRNLDLLLERGILCRITPESGGILYELRREEGHHHHVICKKCGASIPLDYCPMANIEKELSRKGFTPTEHRFEIYGYCNKCSKKTNE
ncbi:MAG: transcriptional repressor [Tepidanaerobacter acetatoxydans]|uniref:Fur family transcriptional regulator n=1 Tax=Tepidanaerobacter acetatoxydans TaxID=499229 RepID=UPI0026F23026|nr:Fur family transcriptional regulator [Tepidanaerobacter acetatoxydans]NLU10332.1 transcriptional repressor [Tepidanaerobacter acetatoxydans]